MEKFSLVGTRNGLTVIAVAVVVAERGESPVDEGAILAQGYGVAKGARQGANYGAREKGWTPKAPLLRREPLPQCSDAMLRVLCVFGGGGRRAVACSRGWRTCRRRGWESRQ